jgi:ABC-2 type transport system permease protein
MKYLVLINPLVYVSEGMRAALTPAVPHMGVGVTLTALIAISALFFWLGIRAFNRRAVG